MADSNCLLLTSLLLTLLAAVHGGRGYRYRPELDYIYDLYENYPEYFDLPPSSEGTGEESLPYVSEDGVFNANLTMPGVQPPKPDTYYCYSMPLSRDQPLYIVGYEALAKKNTAHHILLFGCSVPGERDHVWSCGEMEGAGSNPPCLMGEKILYAWAMDAPPLKLPQDVGFEIGGDTGIDYLVLQVHYNNVDKFQDGVTKDFSGIEFRLTFRPQEHLAGVYFMVTNEGEMKPKIETKLEAACEYDDYPVMHPFAYRVHTHKLGRVVSGYRIRDSKWVEIGKRDPQLPQMFYPVSNSDLTIENGDTLAMRCTFEGDSKRTIKIGATTKDEMCNFYIMFYTRNHRLPKSDICITYDYHWADNLENIPDKLASTLPGGQGEE